MKFLNLSIKLTIFLFVSILLIPFLFGCSLSTKNKSDNDKIKILYEDVAEVSVFKREQEQIIQLPLILNIKTDDIKAENYEGENFNKDAIKFQSVLDSSSNEQYCYILTLRFNAKELLQDNKNALINAIDLKINNELFKYKFGTAEVINKYIINEYSDLQYNGLGTGYQDISTINCSFTANKAVDIESINTTNNLEFENLSKYTGKLNKGASCDCLLEVGTPETKNKLYYCFDIFVNYKEDGKDKTFYFTSMNVQTSIKNRFPVFLDNQKGIKE